ncbi:MAG: hypothetical protein ACOX7B_09695 [Christensenellales bacterium]
MPQVSVLAFQNCPGLGCGQLPRGIGVGHIKHIAQSGRGLAIIQQGYAFGASLDIAVMLLIPFVIGSAGSGIRALGMDGQLVWETIGIEPGSSPQKGCPVRMAAGDRGSGILNQLEILPGGDGQLHPSFGTEDSGKLHYLPLSVRCCGVIA